MDRTQPRIPFFRQPIGAAQVWPASSTTASSTSNAPDVASNEHPKPDVADTLFDRLALVQRVVRFGNSAPPPIPRTPEIRVMEVPPAEDGEGEVNAKGDASVEAKSEVDAEKEIKPDPANSKSSSEDTDSDDDQPLAFKAGGRASLTGLSSRSLSPHPSPNARPHQPHIQPPTLQLNGQSDTDDPTETKTHAHILLRILYVYSLLHPHHPYTQGLNELLAPLYYTVFEGRTAGLRAYGLGVRREELVGEAAIRAEGKFVAKTEGEVLPSESLAQPSPTEDEEDDPAQHIEADTFWLFVELMGELGSVVGDPGDWSLPPVSSGSGEGVRGVMVRLSERLRWADARLWEDMVSVLSRVGICANLTRVACR